MCGQRSEPETKNLIDEITQMNRLDPLIANLPPAVDAVVFLTVGVECPLDFLLHSDFSSRVCRHGVPRMDSVIGAYNKKARRTLSSGASFLRRMDSALVEPIRIQFMYYILSLILGEAAPAR